MTKPTGNPRRRQAGYVRAIACVFVFCASAALPAHAATRTPPGKFVRTANHFLRAGTDISPADYPLLASYDIVTFPSEAQEFNPELFPALRKLNPDIIILAYVPTKSYNFQYWTDPLHLRLLSQIKDDWWLTDSHGTRVSVWPGTNTVNSVTPYQDVLPHYVHDALWSTGLWDGIFYDEFSTTVSWLNSGDLDLHRTGQRDDPRLADVAWKRAMLNMLRETRDLLGPDAVIVLNGDSDPDAATFVNGRFFESFPTPWEGGGTWRDSVASYLRLEKQVGHAPVFIINGNTKDTGNRDDFRKVRYTLASTLLGDGYFSFDFGETSHGQLWRYDEEDVNLGAPVGGPRNALAASDMRVMPGVWRRDFENGTALVNSTTRAQTIELGVEFEKLRGKQAPDVNDGSVVTSVTLAASDGILLRRRNERIIGMAYPNGAFASVFDTAGAKVRNGFFAYDRAAPGATNVIETDLDHDGKIETVSGGATRVTVRDHDGALLASFAPYGESFSSGVEIAVGDVTGDGAAEIVTGTGPGGGPHVRIFSLRGRALGPGFFAADARMRGGVSVAVQENGTAKGTIVTGAGAGDAPLVRLFSASGQQVGRGFTAYDPRFRGGIRVASGDVDGDGKQEIITGAGPGGGPHVRIFSSDGRPWGKGFFAGDPSARQGVRIATADSDADGKDEIFALTTDIFKVASK